MKKIISIVLTAVLLVSSLAFAKEPLDITAKSAILTEQSSGKILYEKNADEKRAPASITKIMTALLVMEEIDSGKLKYTDMVTASSNIKNVEGTKIFLEPGEQMSVEDLLKGLMIISGNDAAMALAEHIGGSIPEFVNLMNKRAKELKMTRTHFSNVNGLPAFDHYSTARDIEKMSRELMKHKDITKFTTVWLDSLRGGKFQLANTNKLLNTYKGITGLKTGYTSEALNCLSATATRGNMSLISVVLGAPDSNRRFKESAMLLDYGFDNFVFKEGIKKGEKLAEAEVKKGKIRKIPAVAKNDFALLLMKNDKGKIEKEVVLNKEIKAPLKKGEEIGKLIYKKEGKEIGEVVLVTEKEIKKRGFFDIISYYFKGFLGIE